MKARDFFLSDRSRCSNANVMMPALRALVFGVTLLAAGEGLCENMPDRIAMSRGFAVAMALGKNPDLRIEVLNSAMSETDVARSRGIYDTLVNASVRGGETRDSGSSTFRTSSPSASLGVSRLFSTGGDAAVDIRAGYTTSDPGGDAGATTNWGSSVGITLSQPLLKFAGKETTEVNITLAGSALQDSLERFRSTATDTVFAVITSYHRLYVLRRVLDSRVAALESAQSLLDRIRAKKSGPLQRLEIANAEFALTQRRKDLVDAERSVSDQMAGFRYLIGLETKTQIVPVDPPSREEPSGTQEQAVQAALEFRPDLNRLRRALKMSQLQERVAKHQVLPDLFVFVSGGLTGSGKNFEGSYQQVGEDPGTFWSAGVELNVPLGNTFAENDYRKNKLRTEQLQNQIQALSWLIQNDVEADLRALISARLQIRTADTSAQFAEQRLEEYRKSNSAGTATVQEVITAENDATAARNAQLDALEGFANGVARLWRDTGELLDRMGVHLDTSSPGKLMGKMEDPGK